MRPTSSQSDVLARVKKLLALSTSSNVHEAASAAAAAQAMIARHQLEALLSADAAGDADGADPITDGREAPLEIAKRPRRWRSALASGLARINGGVAWSLDADDGTHLCFCGHHSDRKAMAVLFEALAARIEWLSATHGQNQSRQWHEAFLLGAVETIIARLSAARDDDAIDDSTALVRVEPLAALRRDAVERFVESHLRFGKGRGYSVDARGFAQGRRAAADVQLPDVNTSERARAQRSRDIARAVSARVQRWSCLSLSFPRSSSSCIVIFKRAMQVLRRPSCCRSLSRALSRALSRSMGALTPSTWGFRGREPQIRPRRNGRGPNIFERAWMRGAAVPPSCVRSRSDTHRGVRLPAALDGGYGHKLLSHRRQRHGTESRHRVRRRRPPPRQHLAHRRTRCGRRAPQRRRASRRGDGAMARGH